MSIAVCVKGPGGIALAADSRRTIHPYKSENLYETWDADQKLISFNGEAHRWVGLVESGACAPEDISSAIVAEVEAGLPPHRLTIGEYAQRVHEAAARRAEGSAEYLLHGSVAGFDVGETEGRVFLVEVPGPAPIEFAAGTVGIAYTGAREFVDRLLRGYDPRLIVEDPELRNHLATPLALKTMTVEECVALAIFLVQTSVVMQAFFGPLARQVSGGPLDAATITAAEGLRFVQHTARDPECPVVERGLANAWPAVVTSAPVDLHRVATYKVV